MRTVEVERPVGTLPVHVWGPDDGVPVLFLHGFPQTSRSWHGVIELLLEVEPRLRLIALDQRGYAPTARPEEQSAYGMEALTGDVLAVADALDAGSVHLVGHDWGASLGWHLAATAPERLRSLVALSIPHLAAYGWAVRNDPEQRRLAEYLAVFRTPGRGEAALLRDDARRLREIYAGQIAEDDVEAYISLMRAGALTPALNWYREMGRELKDTPAVAVPTTYAWGSADQAVSRAAAQRCAAYVTGDFRFVEFPGASHWTPDECPDAVADVIIDRIRG